MGRPRKRDNLLTVEGGRGGQGAESYDRKKAWLSVNNSKLSDVNQNSSSIPCVLLLYNLLRGRGKGVRRSRIILSQESLVLYK
jgi:hypothetical protein